jgi:hypothetical protein
MKAPSVITPCLVLLATPFAFAQEEKAAAAIAQDPVAAQPAPPETKELARFVGNWNVTVKNYAVPGAEPVTMEGTDETKFVCNGLWLLTKVTGQGMPFSGISISGFDTSKKKYVGVWVDSMSAQPSLSEGAFDAKTGQFVFHGEMAMASGLEKTRSTCEFSGADKRTEKVYIVGKDGKETLSMELISTRVKGPQTVPAAAGKGKVDPAMAMPSPKDAMHAYLAPFAGNWEAKVTMSVPGMPAEPTSMKQVDTLVCGDLWLHTHATGSFGGMPFEGHGLWGYDASKKQYVSFWIDGMAPVLAQAIGTCDKDGKIFTMRGASIGPDGQPVTTNETTTWKGPDSRTFVIDSKGKDGKDAGKMTIEYTRGK